MRLCNNCKNIGKYEKCKLYGMGSSYAEKCSNYDEKKQTNADRIRSMSDEELAEIIMCPYDTAGKPAHIMPCVRDGNIQDLVSPEYCKKCMMDWLQ